MSLDIIARGMAASADNKASFAVNMIADFPTGLKWKGSCTWNTLPDNSEVGDAWTVIDRDNAEYAWNGNDWIRIDISNVDQTYDPTSQNAQSGIAVAGALNSKQDKPRILDYITYTKSNNQITITGLKSGVQPADLVGEFIIPKLIEGCPVVEIDSFTFENCSGITSITIPNTVKTIHDNAFNRCYGLTNITIADSVTSIEPNAFQYCNNLTSISIPNSITLINIGEFRGCTNLSSVFIPVSVTQIYSFAFTDCNALTDVYYEGSEADWNNIIISSNNDPLLNATIHYNQKLAKLEDVYNYHDNTKQDIDDSVGEKTPEKGEIFNILEGEFVITPTKNYPSVGYMSSSNILVSGQSYTFTCKFTTTNPNFNFSTGSGDLRQMFAFWGANSTNTSNAYWWRMTSHTISYDSNTQIVTAKFTASDDSQGIPNGGYAKIVMGDRNANFRGTGTYYFSEPSFVNDTTPTVNILANCPIDSQHYVMSGSDNTLADYKGLWVSYDDSLVEPAVPTLEGGSICKAGYLSHAEGDGTWATAKMSHAEGRGNNFELRMDDDFSPSGNRIYIRENQDYYAQAIRKNAVIAVPLTNGGFNFYYAIDGSKYDEDRDVYYVDVDRNVNTTGISYSKPMLVIMGGSTSSWAHTEGNFTNAVDLTATDLEDTADNKTRQHAEGSRTLAAGYVAHAEGEYTQALANHSHAGGEGTIADQIGETAIGRYNDPQSGDLFEIGNGSDGNRSNAFRVTESGKVIGGSATESTDSGLTLVTKTYIDDMFVTLTQDQYDALTTKDPNTYYFIVEE